MQLTQAVLKELLHYDPETGAFERKLRPSRRHPTHRRVPSGFTDDRGYVIICLAGKYYKAHRIAVLWMTGDWPLDQVDHIDGNKSNNRWTNLREATNSQNQANTSARKNNSVGLKGAHRAAGGRWTSRICVNGRCHFLGLYDTPEEAHAAYAAAAARLQPDFWRV